MDPATLAASVTSFLAPFLLKAGQSLAERALDKLPDGVSQVWDYISQKFTGRPAAEEAIREILSLPDDTDNREAFVLQLKKILKENPAVMDELASLLQAGEAKISGGDIGRVGSGAAASGGSVAAGAGGIAIQGDVSGNIIIGNNNSVNSK